MCPRNIEVAHVSTETDAGFQDRRPGQLGEVHSICLGSGNVRPSYGSSDSCRMEPGLEVLKDPPAKLLPRLKAYRARLQGQELRRAVIKEAGGRGTAGPSKQSLRPYQLSPC